MSQVELLRPRSLLVFTTEPILHGYLWARMFSNGLVRRLPQLVAVDIDGVEVAFCPSDTRNRPGGSPVTYWWCPQFNLTRYVVRDWGCVELHYPIANPDGTQMTQFEDPFGAVFGLQGPVSGAEPVWPDANLRTL